MSVGCVLIERHDGWRLILAEPNTTSAPKDELLEALNPQELASQVHGAIARLGGKHRLVIAPDSPSCFFAKLDPDAVAGLKDRRSIVFEMESSLPFDAESAIADVSVQDDLVTGIAIEERRWAELVESLDAAGVLVESIVPMPILAASALLDEDKIQTGDLLIWSREKTTDLLLLGPQRLDAWRHISYHSNRLAIEIAALRAGKVADENLRWINMPDAARPGTVLPEEMESAAARGAASLLQRREPPWYELRRDRLAESDPIRAYRGPLRILATAVALMLLVTIAASFWRKTRLDLQTSQLQQEQRDVFQKAFPGTRVPAALLSRIRSEHRKALGSRKTGGNVPSPQSALEVLDSFLAGISDKVRFQITQVNIQNGELSVDLRLNAHNDAGKLAASLESSGFAMLPPGTDQIDPKTVGSQLQGTFQVATEESTKTNLKATSGGSS